jgi:hypothetical protein
MTKRNHEKAVDDSRMDELVSLFESGDLVFTEPTLGELRLLSVRLSG